MSENVLATKPRAKRGIGSELGFGVARISRSRVVEVADRRGCSGSGMQLSLVGCVPYIRITNLRISWKLPNNVRFVGASLGQIVNIVVRIAE